MGSIFIIYGNGFHPQMCKLNIDSNLVVFSKLTIHIPLVMDFNHVHIWDANVLYEDFS